MRPLLPAALLFLAAVGGAQAQTATAPKAAPAASPARQTPAETARALAQNDRVALQSDLVWTGFYNGSINGDVSDRMIAAIKTYQKDLGDKETGALNPQQRTSLAASSRKAQDNVGWKVVTDMVTGARVGIPAKLLTRQASDANGTRWSAPQDTVQVILARRKEAGATMAAAAEREKKEPAGRKIDYSAVRPDFFVLSGLQGLKKFYLRGQISGDEVRVLTILYDQATEGTMGPVVIAMSSAFAAFPGAAPAQVAAAPRKKVEYATGIVVSADGFIVTDRQAIDGCQTIAVPKFGNADKVADDKALDLALLRIYGASGLKPLAIDSDRGKSDVAIYGIADPLAQSGGSATTSTLARVSVSGSEIALQPVPAPGFSGAAVLDSDGKFAGMAQVKPVAIAAVAPPVATTAAAASAPAASSSAGAVVPGPAIREFLARHKVAIGAGTNDAREAVVRVICVRK